MIARTQATAVALASAALALGGADSATAASGGTITYVQGGNVWLVTPDGQHRRQLTKDGATTPWTYPSLAPDGSVVAIQANQLVHLAPDGATLSRVTPERLLGPAGQPRDGEPEWVDVSPDGTKVAWGTGAYVCDDSDPTCAFSSITGITDIDRPTAVSKYGQAPSLRFGSWITNTRLVGTENSNSFWTNLWDVGAAPRRWFESYDQLGAVWDMWEPEVSPSRRLLASVALRPNQRGVVVVSRSEADLGSGDPAMPVALCGIAETKRTDASPTWSPDNLELAYADAKGIQVTTFAREVQEESDCITPESRVVAPAGSVSPDWGAAEPLRPPGGGGTPQTSPVPTPAPTPQPTPAGGCRVPKAKAGASLTVVTRQLRPCKVRTVRQRSAKVKKGRVIRIARKAGTRLPAGAKVTVYVSKGR